MLFTSLSFPFNVFDSSLSTFYIPISLSFSLSLHFPFFFLILYCISFFLSRNFYLVLSHLLLSLSISLSLYIYLSSLTLFSLLSLKHLSRFFSSHPSFSFFIFSISLSLFFSLFFPITILIYLLIHLSIYLFLFLFLFLSTSFSIPIAFYPSLFLFSLSCNLCLSSFDLYL